MPHTRLLRKIIYLTPVQMYVRKLFINFNFHSDKKMLFMIHNNGRQIDVRNNDETRKSNYQFLINKIYYNASNH